MFGGAMAVEPIGEATTPASTRSHHKSQQLVEVQILITQSLKLGYIRSMSTLVQTFYITSRLHIINNPFFLTHGLSLQACRLHLSWSNTYMGDSRPYWRVAMSSTCNPPSPDTSDCRPPSFSHLHELLLPPFHLCRSFYEDSESICLDLNNLYLENL